MVANVIEYSKFRCKPLFSWVSWHFWHPKECWKMLENVGKLIDWLNFEQMTPVFLDFLRNWRKAFVSNVLSSMEFSVVSLGALKSLNEVAQFFADYLNQPFWVGPNFRPTPIFGEMGGLNLGYRNGSLEPVPWIRAVVYVMDFLYPTTWRIWNKLL